MARRHKHNSKETKAGKRRQGFSANGNGVHHSNPHTAAPREQHNPDPAPKVKVLGAAELLALELPEPRWAVEGIIPAGLSILAGKPKLGKSWLALNVAIAVAMGETALYNIAVERGRVLYLALEDTTRRLQDRLKRLLEKQEGGETPNLLELVLECPGMDDGGLLFLREWLEKHRDVRLVVIDTWQKVRPMKLRGGDAYEQDYEHSGRLKKLADEFGVAILVLHHCRKLEGSDPIDSVSGTLGLTGSADAVMVLKRNRGRDDATLFVSGRDMEEKNLALRWDPAYCLWSIVGQAEEDQLSKERADVIALFKTAQKFLSPSEAAPMLKKTPGATKNLFWRMANDGQLLNVDGKYALLP